MTGDPLAQRPFSRRLCRPLPLVRAVVHCQKRAVTYVVELTEPNACFQAPLPFLFFAKGICVMHSFTCPYLPVHVGFGNRLGQSQRSRSAWQKLKWKKEAFQKATLLIFIARRPRACDQLRKLYENNTDRLSRLDVTALLHERTFMTLTSPSECANCLDCFSLVTNWFR